MIKQESLHIKESGKTAKQNTGLLKPIFLIIATLTVYMVTFKHIGVINHIVFAKSIVPAFIVLAIVVSVAFLWGNTVGCLLKPMERKIDSLKAARKGD